MWIRTIKITFANELMKKSIRSHLSETIDLTESMILVYRVDLSSNVSLVNHFFPSKEALESFSEKLKRSVSNSLPWEQRSRSMMGPSGALRLLAM